MKHSLFVAVLSGFAIGSFLVTVGIFTAEESTSSPEPQIIERVVYLTPAPTRVPQGDNFPPPYPSPTPTPTPVPTATPLTVAPARAPPSTPTLAPAPTPTPTPIPPTPIPPTPPVPTPTPCPVHGGPGRGDENGNHHGECK